VVSQDTRTPSGPERFPEVWGEVVPQRNINFTGRDELLDQLGAGLAKQVTAVLPHALHGLGGVGKTQVAVEYAYRNRSAYDVVWWIPADQPTLVRSSLAALAPHLGLPDSSATGIQEAASAVINALRRGEPYSRWLLVFDNANEPEDINDLIPRGPGHSLVTSRSHRWRGVVDTLPVDVFSRAESVQFLSRRIQHTIDTTTADALARALGDLPLALEQAGALQAETGMGTEEYLELLGTHTKRLLTESRPSDYPLSMTAAWRISVERLTRVQPAALELLRCCAFFGPEPIPRDVFRKGIRASGSQLSDILSDAILLARVIRDLGRFALATVNPVNRTIQVHRLIQALLRDDLDEEQQATFRHEVHLLLAGTAPTDPNDQAKWPVYAELVAHVLPSEMPQCQARTSRRLGLAMIRYLHLRGDFASSREFAEEFLAKWIAASGEDDPDVLTAQWYLGDLLRDLGEFRAAYAVTESALARAPRVLEPGHETAMALATGFGADLRALGDFPAAYQRDTEALRVCEDILGPDHPRTILARNCLALDYQLIGDYPMARDLQQQAYDELSRATSMISKVDVLASWAALSRAVRLSGAYTDARILAEDAYEFGVRELGPDHMATLRTGRELAIALRIEGEVDASVALARDLLARSERVAGTGDPSTLATATALANSLRVAGQLDEALAITEDVTTRLPAIYQAGHPYIYGCEGNHALLHRLRGDVGGAITRNKAALAGLESRLGRDHDYTLMVAINLASDLAAGGDAHAARELGEDTYERLRRTLGEKDRSTLGCASNLALDLRADGATEEANRLAAMAADEFARTLGPTHRYARAAQSGLRLDFDFDPPTI
jgi:tetratricopeptide (TPR) repeat protein